MYHSGRVTLHTGWGTANSGNTVALNCLHRNLVGPIAPIYVYVGPVFGVVIL